LAHEMMEAAQIGRADVHARPAADGLEALEDLDVGGAVRPRAVAGRGLAVRCLGRPDRHRLSLRATGADQQLVEPLEVLVGIELDRDAAARAALGDLDLRAECAAQLGRYAREIGIVAADPRAPAWM